MDLEKKIWVFLSIAASILGIVFWKFTLFLIVLILALGILCLGIFIGAIVAGILLFVFCFVVFAGAMIVIAGKFAFTDLMWISYMRSEEYEDYLNISEQKKATERATIDAARSDKKRIAYPLWRKGCPIKRNASREHLRTGRERY